MRTTLTVGDDIFAAAKNLATLKNVAIGTALSELARAGLHQRMTPSTDQGLPVFRVSERAPVFGFREVQSGEDEI